MTQTTLCGVDGEGNGAGEVKLRRRDGGVNQPCHSPVSWNTLFLDMRNAQVWETEALDVALARVQSLLPASWSLTARPPFGDVEVAPCDRVVELASVAGDRQAPLDRRILRRYCRERSRQVRPRLGGAPRHRPHHCRAAHQRRAGVVGMDPIEFTLTDIERACGVTMEDVRRVRRESYVFDSGRAVAVSGGVPPALGTASAGRPCGLHGA